MKTNQESELPPATPCQNQRPKVLFLWYDISMPLLVARTVEDEFEVVPVTTRDAALEALATTPFCAFIYNFISCIRGVGIEFAAEIQSLGYHVPIIIVTCAFAKKEFGDIWWDPPDDFMPGKVFAIVSQPFTFEIILTVLRAALARSVPHVPGIGVPPPLPQTA